MSLTSLSIRSMLQGRSTVRYCFVMCLDSKSNRPWESLDQVRARNITLNTTYVLLLCFILTEFIIEKYFKAV